MLAIAGNSVFLIAEFGGAAVLNKLRRGDIKALDHVHAVGYLVLVCLV